MRTKLAEIERLSVEHHTTTFQPQNVRKIVRGISNVSMEIGSLIKRKSIGGGASNFVAEFRRAITGKNFDQSSYETQSETSNLILGIEISKDSFDKFLLEALDSVSNRRRPLRESINRVRGKGIR